MLYNVWIGFGRSSCNFAIRQQSGKYAIFIIQFKIYLYSPDDRIVDEIKKMKVEMDIKFQNMDANFQQMDAKFQQIDAKSQEMKERSNTFQNQINAKFQEMKERSNTSQNSLDFGRY